MKHDPHRAAWTALIEGKPTGSRTQALGRLKTGERNKTEGAYESYLEIRKRVGEILWYEFERVTLRIADDVRYTPDFAVLLASGIFEIHELKGTTTVTRKSGERVKKAYVIDDARVKLRVAADMFPMVFKLVYQVDGNWVEEEM